MAKKREQIHEIEHEADRKKHELMNMLNKAFITPIEREDIVSLAQNLEEFPEFRKSTKLKEYLIRINDLEEKGDHLFIEGMRALHTGNEDALTVIAWRGIYSYLERYMDACEHAADIVEAVIMKNS